MIYATRKPSRRPFSALFLAAFLLATILVPSAVSAAEQDQGRRLSERVEDIRQHGERLKKQFELPRSPYIDVGEWQPFFQDAEGNRWSFVEPMEQYDDETWMDLRFSKFRGNRSRLGVWWVEDQITPRHSEVFLGDISAVTRITSPPLQAIEGLLTTALFNTRRFELVERKRTRAIFEEQFLGEAGRTTHASAPQLGEALGVDYLLFVELNEWTPRRKARGAITLFLGQTVSEVALSFKVVETNTGRVVFADTVRGQATNRRAGVPFFGLKSNAPINYAVTAAVNKAAYRLTKSLPIEPWQGAVASMDGDLIVINGGRNRGVEPGMKLLAVSRGGEVRDPQSGALLGHQEEVIGSMRVTTVQDQMATAVVLEGCEGLVVGDLVWHDQGDENLSPDAAESTAALEGLKEGDFVRPEETDDR